MVDMAPLRGNARGGTAECRGFLDRVVTVLKEQWPSATILHTGPHVPLDPFQAPLGQLYVFESPDWMRRFNEGDRDVGEHMARLRWEPRWEGPYVRTLHEAVRERLSSFLTVEEPLDEAIMNLLADDVRAMSYPSEAGGSVLTLTEHRFEGSSPMLSVGLASGFLDLGTRLSQERALGVAEQLRIFGETGRLPESEDRGDAVERRLVDEWRTKMLKHMEVTERSVVGFSSGEELYWRGGDYPGVVILIPKRRVAMVLDGSEGEVRHSTLHPRVIEAAYSLLRERKSA